MGDSFWDLTVSKMNVLTNEEISLDGCDYCQYSTWKEKGKYQNFKLNGLSWKIGGGKNYSTVSQLEDHVRN